MQTIPLTKGQVTTVCDCHAHLVVGHKWHAHWHPHKQQFLAARSARVYEWLAGKPRTIFMHAVINGTPKGMLTDHRDNDSLNNQCSNLRTATHAENQHNRGKGYGSTSGYKGVTWEKSCGKWRAQIGVNGEKTFLGRFDNIEEAARAYDEAARELHGEFAKTNF